MTRSLLRGLPSIATTSLILLAASSALADNWPQWRGPRGDGLVAETRLPVAWSEGTGIAWKIELPEWGTSTPAIWNDAILVTAQREDGTLLLLKIDRRSQAIEWTREIGTADVPREADSGAQKFHRWHNMASPSPVTDGEVVVAHFGNGDLAALDFDGQRLWQRNLADDFGPYTIWWGHANSPVLYGDLVISVCMQDSLLADGADEPAPSYLVAHDKRTGEQRWHVPRMTDARAEECDSYTTPLLVQTPSRTEMIVMGANVLDAYDPTTGQRLWHLPGIVGGRTVTGPVAGLGMIFATQGMRGPLLAVQPRDEGELDRTDIAWRYNSGTSDTCCPVLWDELLFFITDDGIAKCLHAPSGNLRWKKRLKGEYKASPIAAEGRVYFLNTTGLTTVVAASPRFERLAESALDDETIASPGVSDGQLFIRGRKHLYAIGRRASETEATR